MLGAERLMALLPLNPIVCPILVGRDAEIAALNAVAAAARAGRSGAVLLAGEAGIGKTRLLRELRARAAGAADWWVLEGRAFEYDQALPYGPIVDMLHGLVAAQPAARLAPLLAPHSADLLRIFPELALLLPNASSPADAEADPEREKRRLHLAVLQLIRQMAAERPVLLIAEDLHWADEASLDLLLYLLHHRPDAPLLVAATFRPEEGTPALATWLAVATRERLAARLDVRPLDPAGVTAMAAAIRGPGALDDAALAAVARLAEGNPFVVEELLKESGLGPLGGEGDSRLGAGIHIPESLQAAVDRRTAGLGAPARGVLVRAAVAGRRFDFALLQALTGLDDVALIACIRELVAAFLVVEESPNTFAFRHALTREAIYAGLLGQERIVYHRAVANALADLPEAGEGPRLVELVHHYQAAGAWPEVRALAPRAGAHAAGLHAPRAAAGYYALALDAAARLGEPPPGALHVARARAHELLGDFDAATADYSTALDSARASGDAELAWECLLALGTLWSGRDYTRAGTWFRDALAAARAARDPARVATSLNRLGNWHMNVEEPQAARPLHEEALALFQAHDDPAGLAATYDFLGVAAFMAGDLAAAATAYDAAIALFRARDDRAGLVSSLAVRAILASSYLASTTGWPPLAEPEAVALCDEALRLAQSLRWRAGEACAHIFLGMALGPRGSYPRALAHAREGLRIAEAIEHNEWANNGHYVAGCLLADLFAYEEAAHHLEASLRLARALNSLYLCRVVGGALVPVYLAQRRTAEAATLLADMWDEATPLQTQAQRLVWAARAELDAAEGRRTAALAILDGLEASAVPTPGGLAIPRLAYLRGTILLGLRRPGDAEPALDAALAAAQALGARAWTWRILAARARLYAVTRRREAAAAAAAEASALLAALAAPLGDPVLGPAFLAGAQALLPAARPASPRPPATATTG